MSEARPNPTYRMFCTITLVLLGIFAVVYCVQCVQRGHWNPSDTYRQNAKSGNDFTAFYSAGEQARLGRNIYDFKSTSTPRLPYLYPPFFAVFPMAPLSLLSHNETLAVFHALNAIMLAAAAWMLRKILWPPADAYAQEKRLWLTPMAGVIISLALSWRFIGSNTIVGNANLFILFFLTLALFCDIRFTNAKNEAIGRGVTSGLAVALAAAMKLTPGLFGIYFLWSWRKWSMLGGAIGLALFLIVIPAAWLGWDTNLKYLRAYGDFVAGKATGARAESDDPDRILIGREKAPDPNEFDAAIGVGVSIRGMLTNLLTPTIALDKLGDRKRTVNVATLEMKRVNTISNVLGAILLLGTVALTFGGRSKRGPHAAALCWGLVTVTMVLISPLTRIAHLVVLLIPAAALVALLQQNLLQSRARTLAWAALAMLAAAGMMPDYVRAIGFMTVTLFVLYAALGCALWEKK